MTSRQVGLASFLVRASQASLLTLLAAVAVVSCDSTESPEPDEHANAWYVRASPVGDPDAPLGSADNPFSTLPQVEERAHEGDTIIVLVSPDGTPLTGPIQLLPGQTLRGEESALIRLDEERGLDEIHCVVEGTLPRISSPVGHAVILADNTTVTGLHIADVAHSGIFGLNVSGVTIENNLIEAFNPEVSGGEPAARDDTIQDFQPEFFQAAAALAGIHLTAHDAAALESSVIRGNCVRQGAMGISLNLAGNASAFYVVEDNIVTDIGSLGGSAVQVIATDDTVADITIDGLFADRLGFADGPSNSDKILVVLEHRARLDLAVKDFVARNSTDMEGRSSQGMELALGGLTELSLEEEAHESIVLNAVVEGADIRNMPSGGIQLFDSASKSQVTLTVRDSVVAGTRGVQGNNFSQYKMRFGGSATSGGQHTIVLEGNELRDAADGRHAVRVFVDGSLDSLVLTAEDNLPPGWRHEPWVVCRNRRVGHGAVSQRSGQ